MLSLERKHEPPLGRRQFLLRLARYSILAVAILLVSLGIGVLGYHAIAGLSWVDALLNASMILTGMGPVDRPTTDLGKLFASFYALYSGVIFLVVVGVMFAPIAHRLLHLFHLEQDAGER